MERHVQMPQVVNMDEKCERDFGKLRVAESWGVTPGGQRFLRVKMRGSADGSEEGPDGSSLDYLWSLSRRAVFVIVDVSDLEYMTDLGFGFDERARQDLKSNGGDCVALVAPGSPIEELLKLCGSCGAEYVSDESSAMARFDGAKGL